MGKKAPDELCRQNYNDLKELFDSVIEDHYRFEMVYASGVDVGLTDAIVVRITTYNYLSYAVGFDTTENEIVVLPITADLSEHGEPFYLKNSEIKKAKQSFISKEITIKDNRLPKKYIQLVVQEYINDDPDDVVMLVKQDEEAKRFHDFFKNQYSK